MKNEVKQTMVQVQIQMCNGLWRSSMMFLGNPCAIFPTQQQAWQAVSENTELDALRELGILRFVPVVTK